MVDIAEFHNDYELFDPTHNDDEIDLTFLEAIDNPTTLFTIDDNFFDSLSGLKPERALVPSLHESTFTEPLDHALWTSSSWPNTKKHFPA